MNDKKQSVNIPINADYVPETDFVVIQYPFCGFSMNYETFKNLYYGVTEKRKVSKGLESDKEIPVAKRN